MTELRGTGRGGRMRAGVPLAVAVGVALTLFLPVSPAGAQTGVDAEIGVSHALPPSGLGGEGTSYLLGGITGWTRLEGVTFLGGLRGGLATAADRGDWGIGTLGIEAGGGIRGAVGWGLLLHGSAFSVGDPTPYRAARLDAVPELRLRSGGVLFAVQGYGGVGVSEIGPDGEEVGIDLRSWGGGARLELPVGGWTLGARAGLVDGEVGEYRSATVRATGSFERTEITTRAGVWDLPTGGTELTAEVSLRFRVGGRTSLLGSGGRSDPDPLLGVPAGDFASARVAWRLRDTAPGGGDPTGALPVRLLEPEEGLVRFRVSPPGATEVSVAGDFSGWSPVPLRRTEGAWVLVTAVEPGLHHYAFRVDGEWWLPEDAPGRTTDEWGRPTATFHVPGARAPAAAHEPTGAREPAGAHEPAGDPEPAGGM